MSKSLDHNTLGIAGFVVSLIGLFSGGLICPVGALLSFIACFRRPRGLAIAGLVIGLLGSAGLLIFALVFGVAGVTVVLLLLGVGRYGQVGADANAISIAAQAYVTAHGSPPPSLDAIPNLSPAQLKDPWGTPYGYMPGRTDFTLTSAGPDRTLGTDDDVTVHETFVTSTH